MTIKYSEDRYAWQRVTNFAPDWWLQSASEQELREEVTRLASIYIVEEFRHKEEQEVTKRLTREVGILTEKLARTEIQLHEQLRLHRESATWKGRLGRRDIGGKAPREG